MATNYYCKDCKKVFSEPLGKDDRCQKCKIIYLDKKQEGKNKSLSDFT